MGKRIYVGNLPFEATEEEVREVFAKYGEVASVSLIKDRDTGRPRGFGFVEMDETKSGEAIEALNGSELHGRALKINEARERTAGGGGGGGGGGRGGRNGDGQRRRRSW